MRIERLSLKDAQKLKYLLQTNEKTPVNETDATGETEYIEIDGELVPVETGYYEIGHEQDDSDPPQDKIVEFLGNLAFSGDTYFFSGGTVSKEYGIDDSDYDAVLCMPKNSIPITETSYIWYKSEPVYEDGNLVDSNSQTVTDSNGNTVTMLTGRVDTSSADYRVVKIVPSLGFDRYLLRAVIH